MLIWCGGCLEGALMFSVQGLEGVWTVSESCLDNDLKVSRSLKRNPMSRTQIFLNSNKAQPLIQTSFWYQIYGSHCWGPKVFFLNLKTFVPNFCDLYFLNQKYLQTYFNSTTKGEPNRGYKEPNPNSFHYYSVLMTEAQGFLSAGYRILDFCIRLKETEFMIWTRLFFSAEYRDF